MVSADGSATLLHPILFNLQELVEKVIRLVHIPSGKQVAFSTAFHLISHWLQLILCILPIF